MRPLRFLEKHQVAVIIIVVIVLDAVAIWMLFAK